MGDRTFTLITHEGDRERTISIKAQFDRDRGAQECKHTCIVVDESLWTVECTDCGEKLDPIHYLIQLAREERYVEFRIDELKKAHKRIMEVLEGKKRTRCKHCGKYTRRGGLE
jgi:ribosomal protein S27E